MLTGSIVALITPMHNDGSIAYDALKTLIDFQINAGTTAVLILGTTGESPTLTASEKQAIIKTTVAHVNQRIPVIVGTGSNCTRSTIDATQSAKTLGADMTLLVNPYYNKPTQEGLYQHYRSVVDAVDLPQMIYNIPGRTCGDVLPETVIRLSKHPNIVGIKECSGDLTRIPLLREHCPNDFSLFSGDDDNVDEFIPAGGDGVISVAANIVPQLIQTRCQALRNGDSKQAQDLSKSLRPLCNTLFIEPNPTPCKWALAQMGLIPHGIRLPLMPLTTSAQPEITNALHALDLITDTTL